jgi:UDP-N-acetylmuramate dehydrogenase
MQIKEHVSLKKLNTFGIDVTSRYFIDINSTSELLNLFSQDIILDYPHLILGGGSNILFTRNYSGIVIHMANRGIETIDPDSGKLLSEDNPPDSDEVFVRVQAGEPWDDLVAYCVDRGWGGLENLSLIPGQAGSSPIQNIGAYGVEMKDYFHSLVAMEKKTGKLVSFDKEACRFGYRDSFFKRQGRDLYVILHVTFRLTTRNHHLHTSYGSLLPELQAMGINTPGIADIRKAVIAIRNSKLPDPEETGNAGSFFKNPTISDDTFKCLKKSWPDMPGFPVTGGIKLAAGWLIEKAGWKAYREHDAGVHHKQALVLVNYGAATGNDIIQLAEKISDSIKQLFDIHLDAEVNII